MDIQDLAKEFMLIEAASGYEKKMAFALKRHLENYCDETFIDNAGNVISKIDGTDKLAPTIMIFAHMDQLGFITRKIEENGLIQIDRLGGIPEKVLPALNVSVSNINGEYIPGIIGVKSHHVTPPEEKYKVDFVTSLFVDVGAKNKKQVLDAGIRIGCPIIYSPSFKKLMGNRICGTAIDNRSGCAALVGIAKHLSEKRPKATTYIVGTVWEEFNLRGAIFAARHAKPDIAICVDITMAGDTPELKMKYDVELGSGPTVSLYNFHGRGTLNGTIAHHGLYRLATKCAEDANIKLQEFASIGMLTDNAYVQLEGKYVACIDMGFPARYTHSPIECCDTTDIEKLTIVISNMLWEIDDKFNVKRY